MERDKATSGSYLLLVWGSSIVFIAPLLFLIIGWLHEDYETGFEVIPLFVLFGLLLSLPALAISYIFFTFLSQKTSSGILLKSLTNLIIIISIFLTFRLIGGSMALLSSLVYSGSVVLASLIYPISSKA